ncbi:hypothetical protein O181_000103 [Austropuccinia psidii MF-1]|uniref:Integrase catalytic domain-containing protein n=1 Tax=Austropuccinia psidii MF-1 TaxID=1389203 RepID=A0A9Q3GAK4_9BASI|nr:hypothetical protein [Austropuccinia psidii MF-1]
MRLSIILDDFIDDPSFLHREGPTLSSDEKICRGIILHSLPEAIQCDVLHLRPPTKIVLHHYEGRTDGVFGRISEHPNEHERNPSQLCFADIILGLIIQRGVKEQPFADTLMMRLENEISNKGINPNLATCQQLLESSFQQHQNEAVSPKRTENLTYQQVSLKSNAPPSLDAYNDDAIDPAALKTVIRGICHNCKKPGHFARDCRAKKDATQLAPLNHNAPQFRAYYPIITPPTYPNLGRNVSREPPAMKPADYYRPTYQTKPTAPLNVRFAELGEDEDLMNLFRAEMPEDENTDSREPVCDTGATHSLTNDHNALQNFRVLTTPLPLSVATKTAGKRSFVTGVGSLFFRGTGDEFVVVKNVFYSPSATATLISPASIIRTGGKMCTAGNDLIFCNASNVPLLTATFNASKRCWFFPHYMKRHEIEMSQTVRAENPISLTARVGEGCDEMIPAKESSELLVWHRMFGHCGMRRLRNFVKDRLGVEISKQLTGNIKDCADCLVAKSLRRNTLLPTERITMPMDIVVSDLMGPFDQANLNAGRWVLTVRDVASTYGECHIIATKADAAAALQGTIIRWETKTGRQLKTLRTDGGGEFWSKGMNHWCTVKGLTHEQSLPMNHEQNGCAERFNRSIADMGRTILRSSKLDTAFWGYAFMWAAYTANNIPNEQTGRLTPTEVLFNEKPHLEKLRIFGEKAYVHIPKENRGKLDDRAHIGHVVMYLQRAKGWLFYVPKTNKLIPSSWAEFPESKQVTNVLRREPAKGKVRCGVESKMDLPFLLNNVTLGNFEKEKIFTSQERTAESVMMPKEVVPKTYKEAMNSTEKKEWMNAIDEELGNMKRMDVFEIAEKRSDQHLISGGWIFAKKMDNMTGKVRYKARYVARGNRQWHNEEYKETFAPTATFSALRLLLTWAAKNKWLVHSFDFTAAYLNAPIDMNIWIRPPEGLVVPEGAGCRLKKALYGTKQAGRCWWEHLSDKLKELGFKKSVYDTSVYFNIRDGAITWIHMDDGIVIAQDIEALNALKRGLDKSFAIKWKSGVTNIIGVEVEQKADGFSLSQKKLINDVIAGNWNGKKLHTTPLPDKCNVSTTPPNDTIIEQKLFLSIIGSLSYVANGTRPDISFAVNLLARHAQAPSVHHWTLLQHLLGYLQNTRDRCLRLFPNNEGIVVASDASWGGEFSRSTHGYMATVHGCAIAWCSKRLTTVAASTSHAEYMALSLAARQGSWLKKLINDVFDKDVPLLLQCDNESTIRISKNTASNKRTRHSDRDFFLINEMLYNKTAELEWVSTKEMRADGLTKCLGPHPHTIFMDHFLE